MELKIVSEKDNPLLKRKEISFSIEHEASTLSKAEVLKEVSKKLNLNPEFTIVITVAQRFGSKSSAGVAHSYASKEDLMKQEKRYVLKRAGMATEEKKEAPKKEAAPEKEEKPAKKEEKAEEAKKE
ncbi:MAG: 30S ribosomal protein S24e [Candidatus Micrarchaeota archaeon]|nr:30S ribosomal protein S24e [Candidatus Micrarchaeota archaeon]